MRYEDPRGFGQTVGRGCWPFPEKEKDSDPPSTLTRFPYFAARTKGSRSSGVEIFSEMVSLSVC